ncbi:MAG: adenosylcobalamin-dependent ribonucleoside-diphosphate reductase [Pseudomonadales bacterium]
MDTRALIENSQVHALVKEPLQKTSQDMWDQKYCLKDGDGNAVDKDVTATFKRVAKALAAVEESKQSYWEEQFLWALNLGATPAGRIIANAGANEYKPATSTINCTVSGTIKDSMESILTKNLDAGLTLKAGCGIGYEFSTLRPSGAMVSGSGSSTSGPLSFMDIFDKTCSTVSSAGGRRGAQMATFDISHPDVMDFIKVKREDGRLRHFNLSLLITDKFIQAVKAKEYWPLIFPLSPKEVEMRNGPIGDDVVWKKCPWDDAHIKNSGYTCNEEGLVAYRVYKIVSAAELWDLIMQSNYDFAEPGFIMIDRVNNQNNNWWCESIRATNPCGEQPLPPENSCLLGSINLTKFIRNPFTDAACFDYELFDKVLAIFTRMIDNVVEINGLPLERQREELVRKRRHGMGFYGLGSALAMLGIKYGSTKSIDFTDKTSMHLALIGWTTGLQLAKEKGPAPIMNEQFTVTERMMTLRPEMASDGINVGDKIKGSVLHARYSRYMQQIATVDGELVANLAEVGARFTHHSSIAPTGTIALSLGNNVSNGIEPTFSHEYSRNIIREGKKTKQKTDVISFELIVYRSLINSKARPNTYEPTWKLPEYFTTASDVTPEEHVNVQAAAQHWIDSSISKTANVPSDYPYDKFKDIYLYAHSKELKGCTTFRFNPEVFQGVLVKNEDLAKTEYQFTLSDGSIVNVKGDEEIAYDGELHTAANLFDALKEGTYGKL